jgi:integrase
MAGARLTKRVVDGLAATGAPLYVYDAELKGFGVRVMPSGLKSWIVEYRPHGGGRGVSRKRMTLGATTTLTPDEARKAARDVLASVQLGADPAGDRRKGRETPTVARLLDTFLEDEAGPKLKASTVGVYTHYARNLIGPEIGTMKANAVTMADVSRLHRKIGRKHRTSANRVLALVSSAYSYGGAHRLTPEGFNPTKGIRKFPEEGRERFLSSDELQRLGGALREAETKGLPWQADPTKPKAKHLAREEHRRTKMSPAVVGAVRLLLFTGCRLREILHLRWTDVDFERGMLFLPDSKTGRKPVILNAPALAILDSLPRLGMYVIAGESAGAKDEKPRSDLKRPWQAIARQAKLEGLRLHDLRHSFASVGAGSGMGLPIVGKLLGHAQARTTNRYAHLDADPLRRASERIGATIAAALEREPGEVVPMKRSAAGQ